MEQAANRPLRLAIVDDYAVVVAGVASFLETERIHVWRPGRRCRSLSDVDIVLYDTFGQVQGEGIDLAGLRPRERREGGDLQLEPQARADQTKRSLKGARGYLSKVLTGPEIVSSSRAGHER